MSKTIAPAVKKLIPSVKREKSNYVPGSTGNHFETEFHEIALCT
jgi:hypothetical protein